MDVLAVICGLVFLDDRVQVVLDPLYLAVLVQLLDHALEPVSLALLPEIDPVLTFIFLMLYASSLILFLFFISTFFDKRKLKSKKLLKLGRLFCFSELGSGNWSPHSHLDLLHSQQSNQQNIRWVHKVLL